MKLLLFTLFAIVSHIIPTNNPNRVTYVVAVYEDSSCITWTRIYDVPDKYNKNDTIPFNY